MSPSEEESELDIFERYLDLLTALNDDVDFRKRCKKQNPPPFLFVILLYFLFKFKTLKLLIFLEITPKHVTIVSILLYLCPCFGVFVWCSP